MAYIGNIPAEAYISISSQTFTTINGTSYTLSSSVESSEDIALFLNNVRQKPSTYTATGTSLTMSEATTTDDELYCVYLGKALQTVNPGAGSVGTSQIADLAVTTAKLAGDAVTTAKILDANVTTPKANFISTASGAGVISKGTSGDSDGYVQLNCSENSHGIKLKSPPHSAAQSYTLTFPQTAPATDKYLQTNSGGQLSFATVTEYNDDALQNDIATLALHQATNSNAAKYNLTNTNVDVFQDSSGIASLTDCVRDASGEYVSSVAGGWTVDTDGTLDTNLLAHYPWENNDDDLTDLNELTAVGSPTYSSSTKKLGSYALELDANTEMFSFTSGAPSWGSPSAMSMATWAYWNSTSGTWNMIFDGYGSGSSQSFAFGIDDSNDKMGIYDATTTGWSNSTSTISKSSWVHLAYVLTTTTKKFYINGSLDNTTSGSYGLGTANAHNRIGARDGNSLGYGGYLDQTLFWNKELVAQEVTDLYNGGSGDVYTTPSVSATGNFVSTATVANASVSKVGIVITYKNNAGTNTLNTDIVAQVSADGGSNYSTVTLAAAGTFSTGVLQAVANDVSVTAGTSIQYKISFANQSSGVKEARITGVSLIY